MADPFGAVLGPRFPRFPELATASHVGRIVDADMPELSGDPELFTWPGWWRIDIESFDLPNGSRDWAYHRDYLWDPRKGSWSALLGPPSSIYATENRRRAAARKLVQTFPHWNDGRPFRFVVYVNSRAVPVPVELCPPGGPKIIKAACAAFAIGGLQAVFDAFERA